MIQYLLAAVVAASPLVAQATIAFSSFDTLVYDNGSSMGGPNLLLAMKTQIPTTFVATRLEVFTGEGAGANSLTLWSHDTTFNRPLAPLGGGTWQMGNTNGWQGAPLTTPTLLTAGQEVWVVWGCQNGSQASIQASGFGGPLYRGSFDGGVSWNGPFSGVQWKFRIWDGPAGHYEVFGTGCSGSAGTPRLGWFGLPMAGQSFDVLLDRAPANGIALLEIGDSDTTYNGLPLPFDLAALGAPGCSLRTAVTATFAVTTDAAGQATQTLTIPANPSLAGFRFWNQWACLDLPANAFGLTFSNGGAAIVGA